MKTLVLESAKGVKGGKVQLAFSQVLDLGKTPTSILGILNASDERFNQQKPRYAWLTAQPEDVQKSFGIDVSSLQEGEELVINMVDPRITGIDKPLNIQITETTEGNEYEVANFERTAKRAGKDGDFITHNGLFIYQRATVVPGEPVHKLIENTERKAPNVSSAIAGALDV